MLASRGRLAAGLFVGPDDGLTVGSQHHGPDQLVVLDHAAVFDGRIESRQTVVVRGRHANHDRVRARAKD